MRLFSLKNYGEPVSAQQMRKLMAFDKSIGFYQFDEVEKRRMLMNTVKCQVYRFR